MCIIHTYLKLKQKIQREEYKKLKKKKQNK